MKQSCAQKNKSYELEELYELLETEEKINDTDRELISEKILLLEKQCSSKQRCINSHDSNNVQKKRKYNFLYRGKDRALMHNSLERKRYKLKRDANKKVRNCYYLGKGNYYKRLYEIPVLQI